MKINKIQKEIFDHMMRETGRICGTKISETETLYTDGYKAFVLPDKIINFNTAKIKMVDSLKDVIKGNDGDKQLQISDDLRILKYQRKETARKLTCQPGEYFETEGDEKVTEVWVNNKFLDYFENPQLFTYGKHKRIVVIEPRISTDICAVILPIRMDH